MLATLLTSGPDPAVLHFLVSALKQKLESTSSDRSNAAHLSAVPAVGRLGKVDTVPQPPPSRRHSSTPAAQPVLQAHGDDSASAKLQQRCDVLHAQVAMAELCVREAAQRQASLQALLVAAQEELQSSAAALAEQSREWSAKCEEIQQREREQSAALENMSSVLSCSAFSLRQLASLTPRALHHAHVRTLFTSSFCNTTNPLHTSSFCNTTNPLHTSSFCNTTNPLHTSSFCNTSNSRCGQQAHQAIAAFDVHMSSVVCSTVRQLLPTTCTVLSSAVIAGPPLPKQSNSSAEVRAAGIASLAFQRQSDFLLLNPELHAMYNADVDAYHGSMQHAASSASQFALLSVYVDPTSSAAQPPGHRCPLVGALQLLLQLPDSDARSSTVFALDGSDECLAQLPVAINRNQLFCIQSCAFSVVSQVLLCCLASPQQDSSAPASVDAATSSQGNQHQKQSLSLISLAEKVFAQDVASERRESEVQRASNVAGNSAPLLKQASHRAVPTLVKDSAKKQSASVLPRQLQQRSSKSPILSPQFSPDMSLRSELNRQLSPSSSPPQAFASPVLHQPATASSPKVIRLIPEVSEEEQRSVLFVQEAEERVARPPIRRSKNNFLIPMYSSEED
jgi:hypothetical protein